MIRPRVIPLLPVLMTFLVPTLFVPAAAADEARRLRILFVIDTNAENIGPGMKVNYENLRDVIGQVKKQHEDRFTWDRLEGKRVTAAEVFGYYRNLKVEPSDALFFYYCGHGGWSIRQGQGASEQGQYLAMSGGNLARSDLRRAMLDKNPHAIFLFTECCSNIVKVDVERPREPPAPEWNAFRDLFFQPRGVVDVTAATRGQYGWTNDVEGGMFTTALTRLLGSPRRSLRADGRDGPVSWRDVLPRLVSDTEKVFQERRNRARPDADIRKSSAQTPQVFFEGEWPVHERYLKIENRTGEPLRVWLWVYTRSADRGWVWKGDDNYHWDFGPGESSYVRMDDWRVHGHKIRFYAKAQSGVQWSQYWKRDYYLSPAGGHRAPPGGKGTFTLHFP